jgi:hypothetical protein
VLTDQNYLNRTRMPGRATIPLRLQSTQGADAAHEATKPNPAFFDYLAYAIQLQVVVA